MARTIGDDWQVLGRTDPKELHSCYFCSRNTPKFHIGWRVQLSDDTIITVGPVCGKQHLGDRFIVDKRAIEEEEYRDELLRRRKGWMDRSDSVVRTAQGILEHEGLDRLMRIKQRTLEMGRKARGHLSRIAAGEARGVPTLAIFESGSPRNQANQILKCIAALPGEKSDIKNLSRVLRDLSTAVQIHNDQVEDYAQGMRAFEARTIAKINENMPEVTWRLDGAMLLIERRGGDRLSDRLPIPENLTLRRYPSPS